MTKKHFNAIASILRDARNRKPTQGATPEQVQEETINYILDRFNYVAQDLNPNFDKFLFERATR